MNDTPNLRPLRRSAEELIFGTRASEYANGFRLAQGTDWTYDEAGDEYRCTFGNGRRILTVRVSRQQLLAEGKRSSLSEGMKRKLRIDLCQDSGPYPSVACEA